MWIDMQTKADQSRPRQAKADHGKPWQTMADTYIYVQLKTITLTLPS